MIQINNGFADYYYLTEEGKVYNKKKEKYVKMATHYRYMLVHTDKERKSRTRTISLKALYKLVYNKNYCIDTIENLPNEEWTEIKGTEGKYQISNRGRVKSLCDYEAILLKPYKTEKGYYKVGLSIDGLSQQKFIHVLVAEHFDECGEPLNETWQVHHIDTNKANNDSINLKYVSPEEHYKIHSMI